MSGQTEFPVVNTDRELYRENYKNRPADTLFVTKGGNIGMNVGGLTIVMSLHDWHAMANAYEPPTITQG